MKKYEEIDSTADIGLKSFGINLKELFENSAEGMSFLMVSGKINEKKRINIDITAPDMEGLLVGWLNEILFQKDARDFLAKRFKVKSLQDGRLTGEIYGEPYDPSRHLMLAGIKAATHHDLKILKNEEVFNVTLIFDV